MASTNRAWLLASRPGAEGMVVDNFKLDTLPMPEIEEGEVLLKSLMISVDPYMRGRMDDVKSYFPSFQMGEPPTGTVGCSVAASKHPDFKEGDIVTGFLPWQEYSKSNGEGLQKCDTSTVPLEKYMSSLAYSGLSAYCPILDIAAPQEGEVAFVSGAAGAVGSVACQVLKKLGCRVVGSAGSAEKVAFLQNIGVEAFNYKEGTLDEQLSTHFPEGIDIYFDNVGGETLEAVLDHMRNHGRIVACGMISQYDKPREQRYGVKNLFHIVGKRLKMQGYIMSDYFAKPEFMADVRKTLREWVEKGELKTQETVMQGFEQVPTAFVGLFKGDNTGKMLVKVA